MLRPASNLQNTVLFKVSGVGCQVSDNRSQMTENRNSLAFVFCHLFSVLCPLYLPDT
jgi:hypothetical protein